MVWQSAFEFVQVSSSRSRQKPRTSGLTSMIDYGVPIKKQTDLLEMSGHLIDIAKLATATPVAYNKDYLLDKIRIYSSFGVTPQMGGQFAEYLYATAGLEGVRRLFGEGREHGFEIVEISTTCVPLTDDERASLFGVAKESGLRVVCEVGLYEGNTEGERIVEEIKFALENDVEFVIVEGAELVDANGFKDDVIKMIRDAVNIERLIFEMPGPGISEASDAQLEALKRGLILEFGADVNLGNISPDEIIETEIVRLGIEDKDAWPQAS